MKKILRAVFGVLFTCVLLFAYACGGEEKSGEYDYSKESIVVTEVQKIAPCDVREFLGTNDYTVRQLFYATQSTANAISAPFVVKVDGVEWTRIDMMLNELPEGRHVIYARTHDAFTIQKVENGTPMAYPYKKAITITVDVSSDYADVCDYQYRRDNGLWLDVKDAPWYKAYEAKYLK